jgi:putative sigma-54 modulation protein
LSNESPGRYLRTDVINRDTSTKGTAMKLRLFSRGLPPGADFREFVETRVGFALARFAPRILEVLVRLQDENGPKGGVDKGCRVSVDLGRAGVVRTGDVDVVLEAAVCRAAERAGQAVAKTLQKLGRDRRRVPGETGK